VIDSGYLKPSQRRLVDVVVSEPMLDDALDTANALFLRLEAAGYRVMLAPSDRTYSRASVDEREKPGKTANKRYPSLWHPSRATVVFVGSVAIGLTLFEMTEQLEAWYVDGEYIPLARLPAAERRRPQPSWSWTTQMPFASGRLCLQAFSPYPVADWVHRWPEAKARALRGQADEIADYLTKTAATIARLVEEGEREAEIRRLEWEEERRRLEERWERGGKRRPGPPPGKTCSRPSVPGMTSGGYRRSSERRRTKPCRERARREACCWDDWPWQGSLLERWMRSTC